MKINNMREIAEYLYLADRFLIISHHNPDGDAIGSSLAFLRLLKDAGKKADFFLPHKSPVKYEKFVKDEIITGELPPIKNYSTIICIDFSSPDRANLPADVKIDKLGSFLINIDHHPDNRLFANLNLVNPSSSSTAEVVFELAKFADLRISQQCANYLLLALLSDTGCLRFDNTKQGVLRIAAELTELGASYIELVRGIFLSKPLLLAKLEADIVLHRLKSAFNGEFIYAILSEDLFSKYNIAPGETEGLIDVLKCIEGTKLVALIYENSDGYRISLRSTNPNLSVGKIARSLGGGGHELAAGVFIRSKSASDAEQKLLSKVKDELSL